MLNSSNLKLRPSSTKFQNERLNTEQTFSNYLCGDYQVNKVTKKMIKHPFKSKKVMKKPKELTEAEKRKIKEEEFRRDI